MIVELSPDGAILYQCGRCGVQATHASEVEWIDEHSVALASCPCCANSGIESKSFIKVHFSPQELTAPNMIHPMTGQPSESHATAHRHMALAAHLKAIGKTWEPVPPPQTLQQAPSPDETGGTAEETRGLEGW